VAKQRTVTAVRQLQITNNTMNIQHEMMTINFFKHKYSIL